jgi:membrane-associated phospholipid phosphatase
MPLQTNILAVHKKSRSAFFILLIIFSTCLITFVVIAYKIVYQDQDAFDNAVISHLSQFKSPGLIHMMVMITFFGSSLFFLPAYLVLIGYLLIRKHYRHAIAVALTSFASWVVLSQIKILFHRHRPPLPLVTNITTFSFPSAHAYSSLIFFSLLAFIVSKWQLSSLQKNTLVILLLLCPLAVGLSRIILNVHYTTDVIAGYCLATMWLILSYMLFSKRKNVNI